MFEHPSHKQNRERRTVTPVLDLSGWDSKPEAVASMPGQLLLAAVVTEIHQGQSRQVALPINQIKQRMDGFASLLCNLRNKGDGYGVAEFAEARQNKHERKGRTMTRKANTDDRTNCDAANLT